MGVLRQISSLWAAKITAEDAEKSKFRPIRDAIKQAESVLFDGKGQRYPLSSAEALGLSFQSYMTRISAELESATVTEREQIQRKIDSLNQKWVPRITAIHVETARRITVETLSWFVNNARFLSTFIVAMLSLLGLLYATAFYTLHSFTLMPFIQTITDFVFIGFTKGMTPFALLLLSIALFARRFVAWTKLFDGDENERTVQSSTHMITMFRPIEWAKFNRRILLIFGVGILLEASVFYKREPTADVYLSDRSAVLSARMLGSTSEYLIYKENDESLSWSSVLLPFYRILGAEQRTGTRQSGGVIAVPRSEVVCVVSKGHRCPAIEAPDPPERVNVEELVNHSLDRIERMNKPTPLTGNFGLEDFARIMLRCELVGEHSQSYRASPNFQNGAPRVSTLGPVDVASIENVLDVSGSAASSLLASLAQFINAAPPNSIVNLVGFASSNSNPVLNLNLSERRANWLQQVLDINIDPSRIRIIGFGETIRLRRPDINTASAHDESGPNRRFVAVILCSGN